MKFRYVSSNQIKSSFFVVTFYMKTGAREKAAKEQLHKGPSPRAVHDSFKHNLTTTKIWTTTTQCREMSTNQCKIMIYTILDSMQTHRRKMYRQMK